MTPDTPIKHIIKRDGQRVRHDPERIVAAIFKATTAVGKPDARLARESARRVEEALGEAYTAGAVPTVEDVQDIVESVLMKQGQIELAKEYVIYRHHRAQIRAARAPKFDVSDNVPYRIIYNVLRWNLEHHCHHVDDLNSLIDNGTYPELVVAADQRYQAEIRLAAQSILKQLADLRIVIVAGPSSSGKTTTTIKVSEQLAAAGVRFKAINIDHYFFNREEHPRDEYGDYDYETPRALDLELINAHLGDLLAGKPIKTPNYDFRSGKRTLDVHPFALAPNEVLLIDSLHGLYDDMTGSIPAQNKYKLYIETLGQFAAPDNRMMRWADNRLLRRMLRDKDHRNQGPMETLTHWHYVRRSELSHIIPFMHNADFVVNSALPYELPILKSRLFAYIEAARDQFADDPKRLDAHIRANRVYELLAPLTAVDDDRCIPDDSLLREFIGGSRYVY
ncbi:MAG: ATP cone domain-containing protein [Verrucomicrobia bacterium]|nr:ATP cone domain-containing protein [Verrucomicrobiota bacterium]